MSDCVVDATVVHMSNGDIAGRRPGNALDRRLTVLEQIGTGVRRLRYNKKLLSEYEQVAKQRRNDVIELFFTVLSESAVFVSKSSLSHQHHAKAKSCRWPNHDQHLLAAAIGGLNSSIVVTEKKHVNCAACIRRHFAVRVEES